MCNLLEDTVAGFTIKIADKDDSIAAESKTVRVLLSWNLEVDVQP